NFQFSNSNFQSGGSNIPHEIKNDEISLQLTGKIDKIEFLDEQNVVVVDYKTSKPKSRNAIEGKTAEVDGNYKRQLVFYKLLLDLDEKFNMKHGEIDFIEPNERGLYKKERFEIEESEIRQLKGAIAKMASEVLNLSFIHSDCGEKDCQYCALGKLLVRGGMKKSEDSGGESISGV
ncbi:MAG: PD-(D/E)XK nuclease family protein, partial [Candidatus Taylorbacteria bacterium]|nr:PD-(D/E)XK nuclease family protein [Candidatus Taylorbacteria bacterium]